MKETVQYTGVSVTSALGAFVAESLNEIAIWMMVMFLVVLVDLFMKFYKIYKRRDEKFRFSKGLRDTMAKCAVYFAFVVTAVYLQNASGIESLSRVCIMAVMAGEGISIASNYLKAHGYALNDNNLIKAIFRKLDVGTPEEPIIEKEKEEQP